MMALQGSRNGDAKWPAFSELACLSGQSFTPPALRRIVRWKIGFGILLGNRALWLIFGGPIDSYFTF
jgi:hypothetical protein